MKPVLEEKSKQVDRTMKRLEKESKEVQAIKEVVDASLHDLQKSQIEIKKEVHERVP